MVAIVTADNAPGLNHRGKMRPSTNGRASIHSRVPIEEFFERRSGFGSGKFAYPSLDVCEIIRVPWMISLRRRNRVVECDCRPVGPSHTPNGQVECVETRVACDHWTPPLTRDADDGPLWGCGHLGRLGRSLALHRRDRPSVRRYRFRAFTSGFLARAHQPESRAATLAK